MASHRKKPFSGKKKKLQLQEKKQRKTRKEQEHEEYQYGNCPQATVVTNLSNHFVPSSNNELTSTDFGIDSNDPRTKK
ncbi:unnamed protein product [Cunninghamella echinulata]